VTLFIGTSGWQYRSWAPRLYAGIAQREWLAHYAASFAVVEVNNTFYQLPAASTFARWAASTPDDFIFACKMSRYLTHIRRLRDPAEPVERFLAAARPLGVKLGPVLLQLPPNLAADPGLLRATLESVRGRLRVAVEFRHPSWFNDEIAQILADHDVALCAADRRGRPQGPLWATASWGYVRFHEGTATPRPCYGDRALGHWLDRISQQWGAGDIYVFFNNDPNGCAVTNATRLAELACRQGMPATRVPEGVA
jgi:uncharacterized protein YecE (DUF72 family)